MILALQLASIWTAAALVVAWLIVMAAIFQDALAPQPMMPSRFTDRFPRPDEAPDVVPLAERLQARFQARERAATTVPWRTAA